jgi:hypothetical protein
MIEAIDVDELKRKFGRLLSYLFHDVGLNEEGIDRLIFSHTYFDFLEENEASSLLESTLEEIGQRLFPQSGSLPSIAEEDGKLVWVGESAIAVSLHFSLPLKSVFLRCPISSFLALFEPYHEMGEEQLFAKWNQMVSSRRLLPLILERTNQNEQELSLISGVGIQTLRRAASSDDVFFAMQSQSVFSLVSSLGVSSSFFKEKSSFDYLESFYFSSSDFLHLLAKSYLSLLPPRYRFLADEIFLKGEKPASCLFLVDDFLSKEEKKELLKSSSFVLLHGFPSYLFENFGEKKRLISDDDKNAALLLASREFRASFLE